MTSPDHSLRLLLDNLGRLGHNQHVYMACAKRSPSCRMNQVIGASCWMHFGALQCRMKAPETA